MENAADDYIPHAVVARVIEQGMTPARAWREYLAIAADTIGQRMGLTPAEYAQFEAEPMPNAERLACFARAVGISTEQVDV